MSCSTKNASSTIINAIKVGTFLSITASLLVAALYVTGNLSEDNMLAISSIKYQSSVGIGAYVLGFVIVRLIRS